MKTLCRQTRLALGLHLGTRSHRAPRKLRLS
jgi:hypothetical protein